MRKILFVLLVGLGIGLGFGSKAFAFDVPINDGFYTQTTPLLTADQEAQIEKTLTDYEQSSSNELAILAVETLHDEPIEDIANTVFRAWGIGKNDKNNGILIVVASADRLMRIEVGYGLEGAVPDIVAKGVLEEEILPQFRDGNYFEGLQAGIDALQKHIGGEYAPDRYSDEESSDFFPILFFFLFLPLNFFGALMARSKSWWLGGVLGGVMGLVMALVFGWWVSIPFFVLMGLGFDYVLSKNPNLARRRRGRFWGGGFGGGTGSGSSGSGGFGGFGGGSSGGGGASGSW